MRKPRETDVSPPDRSPPPESDTVGQKPPPQSEWCMLYVESSNSYQKNFPVYVWQYDNANCQACQFFLFPDRCYPLSTRACEYEYGCIWNISMSTPKPLPLQQLICSIWGIFGLFLNPRRGAFTIANSVNELSAFSLYNLCGADDDAFKHFCCTAISCVFFSKFRI